MWLKGLNDVVAFVREQHLNNIGFTPVTNFHTCTNPYTGYKAFTRVEAATLNRALEQAKLICAQEGKCLYQICIEVFHEITSARLEALALGLDAPPEPPFYTGDPTLSFNSSFKKKPAPKRKQASKCAV